ncbi:hypothetical protein ACFRDV_33730 [Streptomyces fagopyri]|uniref:hypothetical protein n=1 Tax=Streptomyces fagopyri TaxID=2662397 RepID=UPI0036CC9A3E
MTTGICAGISSDISAGIEAGWVSARAFFAVVAPARALGPSVADLGRGTLRPARKPPVVVP